MKEKMMDFIIDEAKNLFLAKPISEVSMEEIAEVSGVGAASLYRYFGTKSDIVMRSAVKMGQEVLREYFSFGECHQGFDSLSAFYMAFYSIYDSQRNYFRFIEEFDTMMAANSSESKNDYEDVIESFRSYYMSLYEKGIEDGSVRKLENPDVFYYSTTHALMNLCKKLACARIIIRQDSEVSDKDELLSLINIILFSLKNK